MTPTLAQSHVLITGGTKGIGRGLAIRYLAAGAKVLITGRNQKRLSEMAQTNQNLLTLQSDLASQIDREKLADFVFKHLPSINVLINNGGIQRRIALSEDDALWHEKQTEINILFSAPVHLISLLLPHMLKSDSQKIIINVTSGGAYIPQTFAPIYPACKAALHSYTMTLRHSLRNTSISVTELIPPAVATSLSGKQKAHGADPDPYCDAVFARIAYDYASDIGMVLLKVKSSNKPPLRMRNCF